MRRSASTSDKDLDAEATALMTGAESQRLPFTLHDDYAPNWDFTFGGSKLILTCSLNETSHTSLPHAQLHVSFGGEQASPKATHNIAPANHHKAPHAVRERPTTYKNFQNQEI